VYCDEVLETARGVTFNIAGEFMDMPFSAGDLDSAKE
jgi:hypothetical protein